MSIADVMTVQLVTVGPEETVRHAVRQMAERNIGAVAVCDDGRLLGIFTERDVLHLAGSQPGFTERRVAEVMTARPAAVAPDDPIVEVAQLMRDRSIRHLPVVQDGRLLGIVSARDVMWALVERLWRSHDESAHDTACALLRRG